MFFWNHHLTRRGEELWVRYLEPHEARWWGIKKMVEIRRSKHQALSFILFILIAGQLGWLMVRVTTTTYTSLKGPGANLCYISTSQWSQKSWFKSITHKKGIDLANFSAFFGRCCELPLWLQKRTKFCLQPASLRRFVGQAQEEIKKLQSTGIQSTWQNGMVWYGMMVWCESPLWQLTGKLGSIQFDISIWDLREKPRLGW